MDNHQASIPTLTVISDSAQITVGQHRAWIIHVIQNPWQMCHSTFHISPLHGNFLRSLSPKQTVINHWRHQTSSRLWKVVKYSVTV